jgi:hypothetical protein
MPALVGTSGRAATDLGETINITQASQLPDPAGGVITLAPNKVYHFHNTVIPAAPLVGSGGTVLKGESRGTSKITIASASPLLGDGFSEVSCLTLINTAGPVMTQTLGVNAVFRMRDCVVINGARDTITTGGPFSAVVLEEIQYQGGYSGVELVGPFFLVGLRGVGASGLTVNPGSPGLEAGYLIKLSDAVASAVLIQGCPIFAGNPNQTELWIDGTTPPAEGGEITLCAFGAPPVGAGLSGVNQGTIGWTLTGNPGLRDSDYVGLMSYVGNTSLLTNCANDGQWYDINSPAYTLAADSEHFTYDAGTKELVYVGKKERLARLTSISSCEPDTGSNLTFETRVLRKRGGADVQAGGPFRFDFKTETLTVPGNGLIQLQEGDRLRQQVRRVNSTGNVRVVNSSLLAS